jgi:release factor glutamine methyltransferase
MTGPTVGAMLAEAKALGLDRLDAQLLLAHRLGRPRTWLITHDEARLDASLAAELRRGLQRRAAGEPLAYLVGEKEFHGLMLQVDARVLVPRPESEALVDWALELLQTEFAALARPRVADLGTGSGAIALAVKHRHAEAEVLAVDASLAALGVARANALRLGLDIGLLHGSWWQALAGERLHLALSNPPYIAADDPHLDVLRHEPALALVAGDDGLDALRVIVAGAAAHLEPGGWLLLEHGHDQAAAVCGLLRASGFDAVQTRADLAGLPRTSAGRLSHQM